jgi:Ca2+-binding RTX toxin-like protein
MSGASGSITGNIDNFLARDLLPADLATATASSFILAGSNVKLELSGSHFTYTDGHLTGGSILTWDYTGPDGPGAPSGHVSLGFTSPGLPVPDFYTWITDDATVDMFTALLAGDDTIGGSSGNDVIRTFAGNDELYGAGGNDGLFGGTGNDTISAGFIGGGGPISVTGSTYLRGEDGDDSIQGGNGFDDINGNQGNDTAHGGNGDDWVVGGKDNDLLFGDDGDDIVWGNLGNDTLDGGNGNDQVRGGQGDDSIAGGAGNDYVSGDRGNDTETGGPGADIFHSFSGAGIDRVLDFNAAEGDRVMLDPGTSYTVSQVGGDVVVDMGNGDQLILQGVQLSSLPANWIFLG